MIIIHRYITKGIGNSPTCAIQSVLSVRAIRVGINHVLTSAVAFIGERNILVLGFFCGTFGREVLRLQFW